MNTLLLSSLGLVTLVAGVSAASAPTRLVAQPALQAVVVDGSITDAEWSEAALYLLDDRTVLLVKASASHLYLAWRGDRPRRFDIELQLRGADDRVQWQHTFMYGRRNADGIEMTIDRARMAEPLAIRFALHEDGHVAVWSDWMRLALPPLDDGRALAR